MKTKLSLFWFAYFAGMGVFFPFFSLYLKQDLELSPSRVGWVLAAIPWIGLIAQPIWGRIADRTGSRRRVLALVLAGTAASYAWLGLLPAYWPVFLGTVLFACFSTVIVPMGTAVSLASLDRPGPNGGGSTRFGYVRLWGTVGFLVSVVAFPPLLAWLRTSVDGPWADLGWLFPVAAFWTILAVPPVLALPSAPSLEVRAVSGDTRRLLRHSPVAKLLVVTFFAHLCMQAPIQLIPLLITERGGQTEQISQMWIFMMLVEIPLIAFSGPSLRKIGARGLLTLGMATEGCRWLLTAWIQDFEIFRWIQLVHGVGVTGIFLGAALYLEESTLQRSRATGQSLVAGTAGLGTIVSLGVGGWIFERFGSDVPYWISGGVCLWLAVVIARGLPQPYRASVD